MIKRPCVEFYRAKNAGYAWRLRAGNGRVILTPGETFISHRNAIASFKRVADAFIAPRVYRLRDLEGNKDDLIRMLERA